MATAVSRTTNPLTCALFAAVVGCVIAFRRCDAPWARGIGTYFRLGVVVLMVRVLFHVLFERVIEYADVVVTVDGTGHVAQGRPADMMRHSDVAPPVVRLGQLLAWDPLPLSVRDARRRLREHPGVLPAPPSDEPVATAPVALTARGLSVRYGDVLAVAGVDLDLHAGAVVALMGRNGSGKSSLLWMLQGTGPAAAGASRSTTAPIPRSPPRPLGAAV